MKSSQIKYENEIDGFKLNDDATDILKFEYCGETHDFYKESLKTIHHVNKSFPGQFNFYMYKHKEKTNRFDCMYYPIEDIDQIEEFDPAVVHCRTMTDNLPTDNLD